MHKPKPMSLLNPKIANPPPVCSNTINIQKPKPPPLQVTTAYTRVQHSTTYTYTNNIIKDTITTCTLTHQTPHPTCTPKFEIQTKHLQPPETIKLIAYHQNPQPAFTLHYINPPANRFPSSNHHPEIWKCSKPLKSGIHNTPNTKTTNLKLLIAAQTTKLHLKSPNRQISEIQTPPQASHMPQKVGTSKSKPKSDPTTFHTYGQPNPRKTRNNLITVLQQNNPNCKKPKTAPKLHHLKHLEHLNPPNYQNQRNPHQIHRTTPVHRKPKIEANLKCQSQDDKTHQNARNPKTPKLQTKQAKDPANSLPPPIPHMSKASEAHKNPEILTSKAHVTPENPNTQNQWVPYPGKQSQIKSSGSARNYGNLLGASKPNPTSKDLAPHSLYQTQKKGINKNQRSAKLTNTRNPANKAQSPQKRKCKKPEKVTEVKRPEAKSKRHIRQVNSEIQTGNLKTMDYYMQPFAHKLRSHVLRYKTTKESITLKQIASSNKCTKLNNQYQS
eukprot:gene3279-2261_t